jgi:TetR/AcrR family transcriptional regulator, tetracycline repressor protein
VPKRQPRGSLNRSDIGEAALLLIDQEGVGALTMRSLAQRLYCDPMTLYRYVDGRDDLLTLVAATVIGSITVPEALLDDRNWFRELSNRFRATLCEHRNVMPIIGHALTPIGPQSDVVIALAQRLAATGLTGRRLIDRYNMFVGGTLGYLALELTGPTSGSTTPVSNSTTTQRQPTTSIRTLQGKAFGFREHPEPALLPTGFNLLVDKLIDAILNTPD